MSRGRGEWLAALLLILVAVTHYGYDPLAAHFDHPDQAAPALFYVLRGFQGLALFAAVGLLARRRVVWAACLWGMLEEGQTAGCRLARGVDQPLPPHELFVGLCGAPWYWVGLGAGLTLVLVMFDGRKERS